MGTAPVLERYRLRVSELLRMLEVGVLADAPVELLDGELIRMNPQGPRHTKLTVRIRRRLERTYGPGYHVQDHSPLKVSEFDLPEPDLVLVRGEPDALDEYATGQDAELVIEIAVSSLARDREKAPIYAAGGVAEYWIVDVPGRRLEVRRGPLPGGREFREVLILDEDAVVRLPGRSEDIDVRALLPP